MKAPKIQIYNSYSIVEKGKPVYVTERQFVPVEIINLKKGIVTFKYLNQNRRWQKGSADISVLGQDFLDLF